MDLVGSDEMDRRELGVDDINNLIIDRKKMTLKELSDKYCISTYKIKKILEEVMKKDNVDKNDVGNSPNGCLGAGIGLVDEDDIKKRRSSIDKVISIDPFQIIMSPTEGEIKKAYWFLSLVEGIKGDYHIRRIHYKSLGKLKPDGEKYKSTTTDQQYLNNASQIARYMGLIDWNRIKDHKNEGVVEMTVYNSDMVPLVMLDANKHKFDQFDELDVKDIMNVRDEKDRDIEIGDDASKKLVDLGIRQPYHLELWIEKSTISDVLLPIIKKYNMTLAVAGGQFSQTNVKELWDRIKVLEEKKVIIFYLRDFDPAGQNMPTAVARKLEWFVRTEGGTLGGKIFNRFGYSEYRECGGLDVRMIDLGLNYAQCLEFRLPREPIDEKKDSYRREFEIAFGAGATEIDSWVALHEEEFVTYIDRRICKYYDSILAERITEFNKVQKNRLEEYKKLVFNAFKELYKDLIEKFNKKILELKEISNDVVYKINGSEINSQFKLGEIPVSDMEVDEKGEEYLLDTRLTYDEQLKKYKTVKAKTKVREEDED